MPHLWARNTWSWGYSPARPVIEAVTDPGAAVAVVHARERHLGDRLWAITVPEGSSPELLFTENDSNIERLFGAANPTPYVKDAFHSAIVQGRYDAVNPERRGTKAAAHIHAIVLPGKSLEIWGRFAAPFRGEPFSDFSDACALRIAEADAFYDAVHASGLPCEERRIQRQAWAGLIWTQQFYHYSVELWLDGDPDQPPPPPELQRGRNRDWRHIYNVEILSMPDKWEYPWYAAWDTAFHMVPMAMIDPDFAKDQLTLLLREWYQHPNGQIPAYEWHFSDVNPPVHAWAAWRVYHLEHAIRGVPDPEFLERVFHKLLLNFTWWVNRKDHDGNNVFQGGFLGLDNIGVFDRSKPLPTGGHIDQADGTAWMAMYCLNMLHIALELARHKPAYEDVASKFFEHFVYISYALAHMGRQGVGIWDPTDGFYYDVLHTPNESVVPLKVRSFVGLVPLFAVEVIEPETLDELPGFRRRMQWLQEHRPHLVEHIAPLTRLGEGGRLLLALANRDQLVRVLGRMFDPDEFLSPYGLRSLSRYHERYPYTFHADGESYTVGYEPAESRSGLFGGNSNWRGPVWFPTNYLMIESLRKLDLYYGNSLTVELPRGSGRSVRLSQAADELARRLGDLFRKDETGRRPVNGQSRLYHESAPFENLILYHEYFHGDTGEGLGAAHQTGWTALVAKLLQECAGGETCVSPPTKS